MGKGEDCHDGKASIRSKEAIDMVWDHLGWESNCEMEAAPIRGGQYVTLPDRTTALISVPSIMDCKGISFYS